MNRIAGLVIAGLVLMVGVTASWGGPPESDGERRAQNTAGGTGALRGRRANSGHLQHRFRLQLRSWSNTSGSRNTASGRLALFRNTTGEDNTASGAGALVAA